MKEILLTYYIIENLNELTSVSNPQCPRGRRFSSAIITNCASMRN
jgi:hypothetical protein